MDGRTPQGILVVFSICSDPAKEKDFNRWYDETHIPDVLGTGAYQAATRWTIDWELFGDQVQTKYLCIYETDMEPTAASAKMRQSAADWVTHGRMHPNLADTKSLQFTRIFTTIPERVSGSPKGLLFVGMNNKEPSLDREFNDWYNRVHGADYMETPGVLGYHRYKNVSTTRGPTEPEYLGLAEAEAEDVGPIVSHIQSTTMKADHGPGFDAVDRVYRLRCSRIF